MATIMSPSDPLKAWVKIASKRPLCQCGIASAIIRRDQEAGALVRALISGEESGTSRRSVRDIATDTRTKLDRGEL